MVTFTFFKPPIVKRLTLVGARLLIAIVVALQNATDSNYTKSELLGARDWVVYDLSVDLHGRHEHSYHCRASVVWRFLPQLAR